jgi:nucleoside-diphosphate-sugar epimerase
VSFFYGLNVLVTGGYGLMGAPLVKMLKEQGANVKVYDKVDGKDINSLSNLETGMWAMDVVFHLAAMSGVEQTRDAGWHGWYVNTFGTLNVLEAARRCAKTVKAVVIASSNHVYGQQDTYPVLETAPLRQLDTYSASKIAADYMARSYHHNYDVPTVIMRNTNCYGPDDPHTDHIIPSTIAAALDGERPVIQGNGLTSKSYLYVDDVVQAYLDATQWSMEHGVFGEAYNVASPPISVLELVRLILDAMGKVDITPVILNESNDQADEMMDDSKLRVRTGWWPQTPLAEGIRLTVKGLQARQGVSA